MDVYLVPVGQNRHELYCEVPDEPEPDAGQEASRSRFRRLWVHFREMLAEAERERRQGRAAAAPERGWAGRIKARLMCWVAESIAEQRLLWHLRRQTEACLYYPDDVDEQPAMAQLRAQLKRDADKHLFWLAIDFVLFVVSGLLALVPGPNVLAYYFAFRVVGHFLSWRGARQGLNSVKWKTEKSPLLSELRRAIGLEPTVRERRVHELALRLRLEHLASFFERTAVPLS